MNRLRYQLEISYVGRGQWMLIHRLYFGLPLIRVATQEGFLDFRDFWKIPQKAQKNAYFAFFLYFSEIKKNYLKKYFSTFCHLGFFLFSGFSKIPGFLKKKNPPKIPQILKILYFVRGQWLLIHRIYFVPRSWFFFTPIIFRSSMDL